MFKLLIVEDERWEREGLVEFLDWPSLGIGTVETACDGVEGLEKALELVPDIVITDIQMPGRNGIEMARLIRERLPDTHIVILTGYDDFQFARDALRFQAVDYLLKPIEEEELLGTMQKVVLHCEEAQQLRLDEARMQQGYETSRRVALQQAFAGLIAGRADAQEAEEATRSALANDTERSVEGYAVWTIRPPAGSNIPDMDMIEDWAEEALGRPVLSHAAGAPAGSEFAVLFGLEKGETDRQLELAGLLLRKLAEMTTSDPGADCGWTIGQGPAAAVLSEIGEAYRQASQALKYAVWIGRHGVAHAGEEEAGKQRFTLQAEAFTRQNNELCKRIRNKLGAGSEQETEAALGELFDLIAAHPGAGRAYVGSLLGSLIDGLWALAAPSGQGAAAGSAHDLEVLHACERREDMRHHTVSVVRRIGELLREKRENKDDYIVNRVLRLVEERYGLTELNLTYLAGEVFVSPNHLGMMFKKKTGRTPLVYIQEYRLSRAEELLRTTKQRVSAIAERVGIPNTSYFGTLFKQAYGMTPGEYQETTQR